MEHDLFRKPVSIPGQARDRLFRDHALGEIAPKKCAVDSQAKRNLIHKFWAATTRPQQSWPFRCRGMADCAALIRPTDFVRKSCAILTTYLRL